MPVVTIELLEGRTIEQKREMTKRITDVITEVTNVKPELVLVNFYDLKKENHASAGQLYIDK
ncbi:MAG: 4-oxalocrotonate tautomerase [Actinobacteria bacterium]|nr:4-oxalocrotonate tautomerase [Actinomycetota bacterium]MBM3712561.1 4-oxalocrotonate tautomerase [Actinomycetota bacterium]